MDNLFDNTVSTLKETESTKYVNDSEVIPDWVAKRYIEISEAGYSGTPTLNRISTTEFSKSDRQILLAQRRIKEPYQITIDVANIVGSALGTALHETILGEEPPRQSKEIGKWSISGQADRIKDGIIYDLKHTSSMEGKKLLRDIEMVPNYQELSLSDLYANYHTLFKYVMQLSTYNWLYNLEGDHGYITFIFNNFTFMDKAALGSKNRQLKIRLATHDAVEAYITNRLEKLEAYQKSGYLPKCTAAALGSSVVTTYKVVAPGKKRAINGSGGAHNTMENASAMQSTLGVASEILELKTSARPTLCLDWCAYRNMPNICDQHAEILAANGLDTGTE